MTAASSAWRIGEALQGREADRVPFFLPATLHGARALGLSLRDYFASPDAVVEGQLRLRQRLGHDVVTSFHHASLEAEAFGGETIFFDDGPPNAGLPPLRGARDVASLEPPVPTDDPRLRRVLEVTRRLAARLAGEAPVLGAVISPFSLPAMQLGLPGWFELLHEAPDLAERLIRVNEVFTADWANAQLAAGASFVAVFDPVASPELVPTSIYAGLARPSIFRLAKAVKGPLMMAYAAARALSRVEDAVELGAAGIVAAALEPLSEWKRACGGRLLLAGGLDAVALAGATPAEAAGWARAAIETAAGGGRFLLMEQHGEIPWQVSEEVLDAVAEVARSTDPRRPRAAEDHDA